MAKTSTKDFFHALIFLKPRPVMAKLIGKTMRAVAKLVFQEGILN